MTLTAKQLKRLVKESIKNILMEQKTTKGPEVAKGEAIKQSIVVDYNKIFKTRYGIDPAPFVVQYDPNSQQHGPSLQMTSDTKFDDGFRLMSTVIIYDAPDADTKMDGLLYVTLYSPQGKTIAEEQDQITGAVDITNRRLGETLQRVINKDNRPAPAQQGAAPTQQKIAEALRRLRRGGYIR